MIDKFSAISDRILSGLPARLSGFQHSYYTHGKEVSTSIAVAMMAWVSVVDHKTINSREDGRRIDHNKLG